MKYVIINNGIQFIRRKINEEVVNGFDAYGTYECICIEC